MPTCVDTNEKQRDHGCGHKVKCKIVNAEIAAYDLIYKAYGANGNAFLYWGFYEV